VEMVFIENDDGGDVDVMEMLPLSLVGKGL
jgi:hypothetical protein